MNQLTLEQVRQIIEETHHHPMGLSGVNGWSNCPGSVLAQVGIPDPGSMFAAEGTLAHELGEALLLGDEVDLDEYPKEMVNHILDYVAYVKEQGGKFYVEQKLDLNHIIPECFGTADAIVLAGDTLKVIDLKYGMGLVPAETDQLKGYLSGAIRALNEKGIHPKRFEAHIYQPRNGGARSVEYTLEEIQDFEDYISIQALKCFEPDPKLSPSDKACQWCRAKATCPALYEQSLAVIGDDFDVLPSADNLTDEQLKNVLDHKVLIESWLKSIESEIFSRIERGESFPGYKMVEGRSVRKYKDDAAEKLASMFGDEVFEKKLKGITTLEKQLGKKHFAELDLTVKPQGKNTLVPESDKREAIGITADDFSKL